MSVYVIELILIWIFNIGFLYTARGRYQKGRKLFLFVTLIMMTVVLGLRPSSVGEDTGHYIDIFLKTVDVSWIDIFTRLRIVWRVIYGFHDTIENGFLFLAKSIHLICDYPQVFLFAIAAVTMGAFGKFIFDNSEDVFLSTYVLLCECIYMSAFNGARQIMALSIGINAYTALKEDKTRKAVAIVVLAALFHNSALVYLLMIPFMRMKKKGQERIYKRFKYVLIVCLMIPMLLPIAEMLLPYILPRYASYFENNYWSINVRGTLILWALELYLVLLMYKHHFRKENSFELSSMILIYLMFEMIAFSHTAFNRVAWYYRGFLILFFPTAINGIENKGYRKLVKCALLVLLTLAFLSYANVESRSYSIF